MRGVGHRDARPPGRQTQQLGVGGRQRFLLPGLAGGAPGGAPDLADGVEQLTRRRRRYLFHRANYIAVSGGGGGAGGSGGGGGWLRFPGAVGVAAVSEGGGRGRRRVRSRAAGRGWRRTDPYPY